MNGAEDDDPMKGERNKSADEEAKKEAELFLAHGGKLKIEF